MTWDQLYTFVESLLFGYPMDTVLFQTYLDDIIAEIESARPWMILRASDASQSVTPATAYTTAFNLGTTALPFRKWYGYSPIVLTDVNGNPTVLREIPFASRFAYKDSFGTFCVDYVNNRLYIMGTITQTYALNQNYIYKSPQVVSGTPSTGQIAQWVFPTEYHKVLGYRIALSWKQVDYDIINLQNAQQLAGAAAAIFDQMTRWDSDLQVSAQAGIDPFGASSLGPQAGNINTW